MKYKLGFALAGLLLIARARRNGTAQTADAGAEARALKPILKPLLGWAMRRALVGRSRSTPSPGQGRFARADVDRILRQLWRNYDELAADIPRQPAFSARLCVSLAGVTIAAYRAVLAAGVEKDEAVRLVADAVWVIYAKGAVLPGLISRAIARDPVRRLRIATNLVRRFPFNSPAFVMEDVPDHGVVAFDVRRCLIAEYFRSYGLEDLCAGTWCGQDYALAEMWGAKLERSGTLVAGDDRCGFRWKVVQPEKRKACVR